MNFLISDTFTDSLARLTGEEQKAVKMTAFDLQMNPANPGMKLHRLEKVKDPNFWSVRVNSDIRLIVHRSAGSFLLCYVSHHDKAYAWAERRKLETHPKTGAAQLVEIRETVQEIMVPVYVEAEVAQRAARPLFDKYPDELLLSYGVPGEWLDDVKSADENSLLTIADHLPAEAAEALLELATGGAPRVPSPTAENPFDHPDAQRRFRVMTNVEELERALDFPWDKWTVFLHPEQRQWVERNYAGPARVSGSAGTGKTIVALHRAVHLARTNQESRVLLTTFSDTLAHALEGKLKRLAGNEPRLLERIDVHSLAALGTRLGRASGMPVEMADAQVIRDLLAAASREVGEHRFTLHFLVTEWEQIVDAWQVTSWESYKEVPRLGRKVRLPEAHRAILWKIFEKVRGELERLQLTTPSAIFTALAASMQQGATPAFDFAVIDEAQDLGISHIWFFAALGSNRPDSLFFAGDLGQRIFQQSFSWKSLGVDIRGRSRTLRINYRTSHQIRQHADRLLGPELSDVDGNEETRNDTVSVFNGPAPEIGEFESVDEEITAVASWLRSLSLNGVPPHEMAVFVRSAAEMQRAIKAVETAKLPYVILDDKVKTASGHLSICTMHLAKGLEFRSVAVMCCDDEVIPSQQRIESVGDQADLTEVYNTERHLLYVACTRAREHLLLTGLDPASEFLKDFAPDS